MTFQFISFHFKNVGTVGFLTAMSKAPANEVPSPTPWALPTTCRGWERNEGKRMASNLVGVRSNAVLYQH